MRASAVLVAGALALCWGPGAALGQPKGDIVEEARRFFDAGAKAYTAGKYEAAVQAFQQAYAISPRPGILFSIGQAYRRQYFLDKKIENLRLAIEHYQRYVDAEPDGARIPDAAAALSELEPIWSRRGQAGAGGSTAVQERTRLMVTSTAPGAIVSIDNGPSKPLTGGQLIVEVTPGEHLVKVSAKGFFDDERRPDVPQNTLLPQDFPLRERPAKLLVTGESGADVSVDGRFVGTLPMVGAIEVEPGRRFITVAEDGHLPFAKEVDLERGEQINLSAPLDLTGQRTIAYALLVTSTAALTTGAVLGGLALAEQNQANDILEQGESEQLSVADRLAYEDARVSRDDLRRAAAIAAGAGLGVGLVGVALYLFDSPPVIPAPSVVRERPGSSPPEQPAPRDQLDLSWSPVLGPGFGGASFELRF